MESESKKARPQESSNEPARIDSNAVGTEKSERSRKFHSITSLLQNESKTQDNFQLDLLLKENQERNSAPNLHANRTMASSPTQTESASKEKMLAFSFFMNSKCASDPFQLSVNQRSSNPFGNFQTSHIFTNFPFVFFLNAS